MCSNNSLLRYRKISFYHLISCIHITQKNGLPTETVLHAAEAVQQIVGFHSGVAEVAPGTVLIVQISGSPPNLSGSLIAHAESLPVSQGKESSPSQRSYYSCSLSGSFVLND